MHEFGPQLTDTLNHVIQSVPVFKPELALIFAFLGTVISALFVDRLWKHSSFLIALLGILFSCYFLSAQTPSTEKAFFGMLTLDTFAIKARFIIAISLLVLLVFIQQYFQRSTTAPQKLGDAYSMVLAVSVGLYTLTLTSHWLMVFIGIETVSIGSYILVGYFSETKRQSEAAMKYVLFGSVSAAVMLYGLSLIYGFTGNMDFASTEHLQGLIAAPPVLLAIAILFMLVGIGFKLGFVPFHLWTPDVYEGAPTPITAFLATVPKIAAVVLFARVFEALTGSLFYISEIIYFFIIVAAIATMLVGNLIALRQQQVKRMMAYSSIGHTGFLLMLLLTFQRSSPAILLFYLAVYSIMNLSAFACIAVVEKRYGATALADYTGLGRKHPLLFAAFTLVGISLIGLPPTAGFFGKLLVFSTTFERYQAEHDVAILLVLIVGALTSVISLFYYFRIPLYAFLRESHKPLPTVRIGGLLYAIAIALAILTLVLGVFPNLLLPFFN
ncbi:NADH-quinone oxidoreductase subunit N [Sphingobacterium sp. Mn56C]|uniref:NADH-quinone oxidoreductase subunit N n=1 Tax=Sphingobacterium sp. Mn56C TaxID=3395261 RepID=UPI003BC9890D